MYILKICLLLSVLLYVVQGQPMDWLKVKVKICSKDGENVTTTTFEDFYKNYYDTHSHCIDDGLNENPHLLKADINGNGEKDLTLIFPTDSITICSQDGNEMINTTFEDLFKNKYPTFSICTHDEIISFRNKNAKTFVSNFYAGNVRNGERLLLQINQETDMDHKIMLYKFLFEEMQYFDDLYSYAAMILGYRVISLLRSMSADINLLYIIENLPDPIKKFPFNETVVFEIYHGWGVATKHLFSSPTKYDHSRTKMALSGPADRTKCAGCYWNMEPFANGQAFRLRNTFTQEYFYADTNKYLYNEDSRWAFSTSNLSCIPGEGDTWQFEPIKNEDFRYRVRNSYYEELLFTPGTDIVVTTRRYGAFANTYRWLIRK